MGENCETCSTVFFFNIRQERYLSLNDEDAEIPFLETVAMGAGSVGASGERMDAMSSPMDDASRNPGGKQCASN